MTDNFYEYAMAEAIDEGGLEISRAKALLEAIKQHRDFTLVSVSRFQLQEFGRIEMLIIDLELDEVPPKNQFGIKYRERLALLIPTDVNQLVEVSALRKDFPKLMHLNQTSDETPANLCLYFDPPADVFRTWTPQNFLKRIIWWLVASSRGQLHPADQPVEQPFFYTKYELVLPWNIEELQKSGAHLTVYRTLERPDGGITCLLLPLTGKNENHEVDFIELSLPSITHSATQSNPTNLGSLVDLLAAKGIDLLEQLKAEIIQSLPSEGIPKASTGTKTVLLLNIPIQRDEDSSPERIFRRAFILRKGKYELGNDLDICSLRGATYFYTPIVGGNQKSDWRTNDVYAVQVSRENDKAASRAQSGIFEEGPSAVLVGVGSLGSTMLNLWMRSGWGAWTVIDNDHIRPHNLSRHPAGLAHIGLMKVLAVQDVQAEALGKSNEITPIPQDACNFENKAVLGALQNAELIVDVSTTLQYPRLASTVEGIARHASVFVTPNGKSAVLLLEDDKREIRLRSLEAQYYRALIRKDWGASHLSGNGATFWSGSSCRDISVVMPYSQIMLQGSTLAEQIRRSIVSPNSAIKVWEHDSETGSVTYYSVEPFAEKVIDLGAFKVYYDQEVQNTMHAIRAELLPNETGGVLVGFYDLSLNTVVIVDALPPPPDSKSTPHSFERGTEKLAEKIKEISMRTAGVVGYVGEWHSHPDNYPAVPSTDDLIQLSYLALGMAGDGLPALQVIVNETNMSISQGLVQ
jgi:integrative and conjugative element protein (TIGR02256 family)